MRKFIVYLAIVALILCPYDCAVKFAAAHSLDGENQIACCHRCAAHEASENSPVGSTEHQPKPSHDGKSCLCEGAVFDTAARSDVEIVLQCSFAACAADLALMPSVVSLSPGWERVGPSIHDDDGRSMRIAMRSLLL